MAQLSAHLSFPLGEEAGSASRDNRGSDITLSQNPVTGKFDFSWTASNDVAFDDTEAHAVVSLLVERRGLWHADPTRQRGSNLLAARSILARTASETKADAEQALQPLVVAGRIFALPSVPLVQTAIQGARLLMTVTWSTPRSASTSIVISLGDGRVSFTISSSGAGQISIGGSGGGS